ncbi:hypothetical protein [Algibacter sp. L4_22]|uniref:DUF6891 domain-containing protein n=1 Tax=Algibacter sp. L4_22 TaxID=2942477 RepID=UPI00201B77F0|nr:hypothetical protein [Algibacter sp. L4_22]MCL5130578.1 hypothetical protein [Algibacter sp. L4_22]
MTENQIEVYEKIKTYTAMGFHSKKELFEIILRIIEDFELTDKTTKKWIKETIKSEYEIQLTDSLLWQHPTDPEKLKKVFDQLCNEKIISLHNEGYENSDIKPEIDSLLDDFEEFNIEPKPIGYCFYHYQDLEGVIDSNNLHIGFNSLTSDEQVCQNIGYRIKELLIKENFNVEWTGLVADKINIKEIQWQKKFNNDTKEWDSARVLDLIAKE